jgi:hypothetical protein
MQMIASPSDGEESVARATAALESDFSVVAGGPLYRVYRRMGLAGRALEHSTRRVLAVVLCAWLPLLVLSFIDGYAWSGVKVPFIRDVEVHLRFLVALPLLVGFERMIHDRMRGVAGQFIAQGLIAPADRQRFDGGIASALRLRDSTAAELILLFLVYTVGVAAIWHNAVQADLSTWYARATGHWVATTLAGSWYRLVSLPIFQFILLRWYFRLFIWARFIWQTSRMDLHLIAMHPDRAGGLGFLNLLSYTFLPLMLAQGTAICAVMADGIFFHGRTLPQYELELFGVAVLALVWVVVPLIPLVPAMARARRLGFLEYAVLAERYVREFDRKWLRSTRPAEPLLGTGDIQSLADLGNAFAVVKDMKLIPVELLTVLLFVVVTLVPILPLVLTMVPLDRLLSQLLAAIV